MGLFFPWGRLSYSPHSLVTCSSLSGAEASWVPPIDFGTSVVLVQLMSIQQYWWNFWHYQESQETESHSKLPDWPGSYIHSTTTPFWNVPQALGIGVVLQMDPLGLGHSSASWWVVVFGRHHRRFQRRKATDSLTQLWCLGTTTNKHVKIILRMQ